MNAQEGAAAYRTPFGAGLIPEEGPARCAPADSTRGVGRECLTGRHLADCRYR